MIHQLSHVWVDFRGIRDAFMREHGLDYFENSRRATLVQQQCAIRNPRGFAHYDERCWGITSSDGPGPKTLMVDGVERVFYGYIARGAPDGPDELEVLTGNVGSRRRWRTMPWLVVRFELMIAPLGITWIVFVIIQPIVIGTSSTIALIARRRC